MSRPPMTRAGLALLILPITAGTAHADTGDSADRGQADQGAERAPSGDIAAAYDACDQGEGNACYKIGSWMWRGGRNGKPNWAVGRRFFQRGCTEGHAPSCTQLGDAYYRGKGVRQDRFKAVRVWREACDSGHAMACVAVGIAYTWHGFPAKDRRQLAEYLQRGCDMGEALGCHQLAVRHDRGRGVPRDRRAAKRLYKRACELGSAEACAVVHPGRGGPDSGALGAGTADLGAGAGRSSKDGIKRVESGCESGDALDCAVVGYLRYRGYDGRPDPTSAFASAKQSCQAGEAVGCLMLGEFYVRGVGVARDPARAMAVTQKACALMGDACNPR